MECAVALVGRILIWKEINAVKCSAVDVGPLEPSVSLCRCVCCDQSTRGGGEEEGGERVMTPMDA